MKIKTIALLVAVIVCVAAIAGCTNNTTTTTTTETDVVAAASFVDNAEDFEKSISSDGVWIICLTGDVSIDKDLVLDADFKNGKQDDDGNDVYQRKIALYAQDEDRTVTDEFTLTVKSLTINSINARIQHGTFVGDIYVNAENFELVDVTVDGNVYFADESVQASFSIDEESSVSGVQEIKAE